MVYKLVTGTNCSKLYFPIFEDEEVFNDFSMNHYDLVQPYNQVWSKLILLRKEFKKNCDFFEIENSNVIVLSQRVFDVFSNYKENLEFLPIETDQGTHYLLNCINYTDCLDKKKSKYTLSKHGHIQNYSNLEFIDDLISGLLIFKIPELPYLLLFTQKFAELYQNNNFQGLDLSLSNL